MYKKIMCTLICLIFLLSISCVVANESIESNSTFETEDIHFVDESDAISTQDGINTTEYEEDDYFESEQQLELNTTGVVMSDDEYSCGAASFATVLNNIGVNITLDEAKTAVNTTVNGTTMEGIINGANKYNLTAYGINVNINYLNENYIVHMSINGTDHWSVVKQISDDYIILADPNEGNINYTKKEFAKFYTNNSIIISKSLIDTNTLKSKNIEIIKDKSKLLISGKGKKKRYFLYKVKDAKYNVNKHRWYYRWVYTYSVYEYKTIRMFRGYMTYSFWCFIGLDRNYGSWYRG